MDVMKADEAALAELYDRLPYARAKRIVSPSARRQRKLAARNELIVEAVDDYAHLPRHFARALAEDMELFRSSGYKADAKYDFPKQAKLRAILDLNKGKALGAKSIANIWKTARHSGKK